MLEKANMPSNGQASLATPEAGRRDVSRTAAFTLLFLLLAILSTFVHTQNECGPEEFLNRTAKDDAVAENNYSIAVNTSTFCRRCDTGNSYCTACYFNISDSQVICESCQSGLEVRDGVCKPSEGVVVPTWVIIVAVTVTVGGSVCIVFVTFVVYRCRSDGCRRTPAPRPRRKLPSLAELDDPPLEVTASTEGRTGRLKKLSIMIRGERYTAGPDGDSRRTQGVHAAGSIGNARPTIASVHYEQSSQVQTPSQETPVTSANNGRQPQQPRSGALAPTSRPTPPVPGPTVTASPRGTALPNGNGRVRGAAPLRPERPVSLLPDPDPADDREIYMNTSSARQSPAHSHAHEFSNPSFVEGDPGQNDDDDGEIYANDTEIGRPAMTSPPPGDVMNPAEDVDVTLPDEAADGREYVNVTELRQQMEQRKQQQQRGGGGGGRVIQDHHVLPEEPDDQEVYENVQAPEKPAAHRRPAHR